jgi:O-antigen/teichoic acid export membrane protein
MSGISLGRVTTLLFFSRALGVPLGLLNAVVLARSLGVDRLGVYSYAVGMAALFALLPNLGISTIVARSIAREPETSGGMVRAAIFAQLLLAGGVFALILGFATILPEQPVPLGYVALAAGQLALGTLSWPYLAIMGGRALYDRLALAEFVAACAGTAGTLAAALMRGGVTTFLLAHLFASGLAVLTARHIARPHFPPEDGAQIGLGRLLRQAAPLGAIAAAQSLYARLDIVILGQLASRTALGLYSAAYKPINMAVYFGSTISGPLLPLMAQSPSQGAPVAFWRAMRLLGMVGPAFGLACTGLADALLRLLFGAEYAAASLMLIILAWSASINWLYAPLGISLQARGHERIWLVGCIVGLAFNTGGNLWAIPRWEGLGAAAATLLSEAALLAFGAVFAWRRLAIVPSWRPILAGVAAATVGAATLMTLKGLGALFATGGALVVYGSLLFVFRALTRDDVILVVGWLREATGTLSRGR